MILNLRLVLGGVKQTKLKFRLFDMDKKTSKNMIYETTNKLKF